MRGVSGRLKKTTPRQKRFIERQALQQREVTARVFQGRLRAATNTDVCKSTVRNRLHDVTLRSRRPTKRLLLTPAHRRARMAAIPGGLARTGLRSSSPRSPSSNFTIPTGGGRSGEHVWDELDRRVRAHHQPPRILRQLLHLLQLEWQLIPQPFFTTRVNSMLSSFTELQF